MTRRRVLFLVSLLLGFVLVPQVASAAPPRIVATAMGISVATMSHVVNLAGFNVVSPGDMWFVCIDTNGASQVTIPVGWTLISQGVQGLTFTCIYKFFATGDTSPITITTAGLVQDAWVSALISGANATYRTYGNVAMGTNAGPDPPSFTVEPTQNVLMFEAFAGGNSAFCDETAISSGYTLTAVRMEDGVTSATVAVASRPGVFGMEDPGPAAFNTPCQWVATTFALASTLGIGTTGGADISSLVIFLILWLAAMALGSIRTGSAMVLAMLILAVSIGMEFAYLLFVATNNVIIPLVVVAWNLTLLAYAVGSLMEKRGNGSLL